MVKRRTAIAMFALCLFLLDGCAPLTGPQVQAQHGAGKGPSSTHRLVDYAGRPCGNQNMHVKAPVCLFPRME